MRCLRPLLVIALLFGILLGVARPWHRTWGASDEEVAAPLPGDPVLPAAVTGETRAITIDAPASAVWPWIAQLGQDRGGFYSYTLLEDLVGCEMPEADRIHPEWQSWSPGDRLWMYPPHKGNGEGYAPLAHFERGRALTFVSWRIGTVHTDPPSGSWSMVVEPIDEHSSRLVVRGRAVPAPDLSTRLFELFVFEPAHFVMERKMLGGVKDRAEGRGPTPVADALEVAGWTALALLFGTAWIASGRRRASYGVAVTAGFTGFAFMALTMLQPGPWVTWIVVMGMLILRVGLRTWVPAAPSKALDVLLPGATFRRTVAIPIDAEPRDVLRALRELTLADIPIAHFVGWLRYLPGRLAGRPRSSDGAGTRAPSPNFLELLRGTGNIVLSETPREIVLGAVGKFHQVRDQEPVRLEDAVAFATFDNPAYQKLAMSVRVDEGPSGQLLVLEHRTRPLGRESSRAFAIYWMLVAPLGHFVSWLLLRAVRRRATRAPDLSLRPTIHS